MKVNINYFTNRIVFLFTGLLFFCLQQNILATPSFCAVGYNGEFSHIDSTSGIVAPKRNDLPQHLQALDTAPDGTLYAGKSNVLYEIDPWTGNYSNIRYINASMDIRGMAFASSGELFISSYWMLSSPQKLYKYDLNANEVTYIGDLWGDAETSQGVAFSLDGILYGITPDNENSTFTENYYKLFTIDLDDAETHLIGGDCIINEIGFSKDIAQSITFTSDGKLYALGNGSFAQLDSLNGSIVGDVVNLENCWSNDFRGLALVPEPMTFSIICLGILFLKRTSRKIE
jgi:hypothetical protein